MSEEKLRPGPELMQEIKETVDRLKSGEIDEADIDLGAGRTIHIENDEAAPFGFRMEGLPDIPIPRMLEASDERPDDYPDEVPFVPGAIITVTHIPQQDAYMVQCMKVDDPDARYEEIRTASLADGWVDEGDYAEQSADEIREKFKKRGFDDEYIDNMLARMAEQTRTRFRKGEYVRGITVFKHEEMGGLMIHQKRSEPEADADD